MEAGGGGECYSGPNPTVPWEHHSSSSQNNKHSANDLGLMCLNGIPVPSGPLGTLMQFTVECLPGDRVGPRLQFGYLFCAGRHTWIKHE